MDANRGKTVATVCGVVSEHYEIVVLRGLKIMSTVATAKQVLTTHLKTCRIDDSVGHANVLAVSAIGVDTITKTTIKTNGTGETCRIFH